MQTSPPLGWLCLYNLDFPTNILCYNPKSLNRFTLITGPTSILLLLSIGERILTTF